MQSLHSSPQVFSRLGGKSKRQTIQRRKVETLAPQVASSPQTVSSGKGDAQINLDQIQQQVQASAEMADVLNKQAESQVIEDQGEKQSEEEKPRPNVKAGQKAKSIDELMEMIRQEEESLATKLERAERAMRNMEWEREMQQQRSKTPANQKAWELSSEERRRYYRPKTQQFSAAEYDSRTFNETVSEDSGKIISRMGKNIFTEEEQFDHPLVLPTGAERDPKTMDDINYAFNLGDTVREELQALPVWIVGMEGSGKEKIGEMLANSLRYMSQSVDGAMQQAAQGATVGKILDTHGKEYYSEVETSVLRMMSALKTTVIVTGMDAIWKSQNWGSIRAGVIIYLSSTPEFLAKGMVKAGTAKDRFFYHEPEMDSETLLYRTIQEVELCMTQKRIDAYQSADLEVSVLETDPETGEQTVGEDGRIAGRVLQAIYDRILDSRQQFDQHKKWRLSHKFSRKKSPTGTPRLKMNG